MIKLHMGWEKNDGERNRSRCGLSEGNDWDMFGHKSDQKQRIWDPFQVLRNGIADISYIQIRPKPFGMSSYVFACPLNVPKPNMLQAMRSHKSDCPNLLCLTHLPAPFVSLGRGCENRRCEEGWGRQDVEIDRSEGRWGEGDWGFIPCYDRVSLIVFHSFHSLTLLPSVALMMNQLWNLVVIEWIDGSIAQTKKQLLFHQVINWFIL